ncbi:hypothetical protein EXIGLDRAFT_809442 [Exidia glandulosa HHB12029]|uniref:Retrotransposon gag domain-containing protein n=1 Tax=Exidia glandulosa HHB12029 TaxID=1314781 RepID=A0A165ZJ95_EXIGL|nr:hypothetical protein EXIGLDRAFT_809442 [Exidia glandulosa HHB12029]
MSSPQHIPVDPVETESQRDREEGSRQLDQPTAPLPQSRSGSATSNESQRHNPGPSNQTNEGSNRQQTPRNLRYGRTTTRDIPPPRRRRRREPSGNDGPNTATADAGRAETPTSSQDGEWSPEEEELGLGGLPPVHEESTQVASEPYEPPTEHSNERSTHTDTPPKDPSSQPSVLSGQTQDDSPRNVWEDFLNNLDDLLQEQQRRPPANDNDGLFVEAMREVVAASRRQAEIFHLFGIAMLKQSDVENERQSRKCASIREDFAKALELHNRLLATELSKLFQALFDPKDPGRIATREDIDEVLAVLVDGDDSLRARLDTIRAGQLSSWSSRTLDDVGQQLDDFEKAVMTRLQAMEEKCSEKSREQPDCQKKLDAFLQKILGSIDKNGAETDDWTKKLVSEAVDTLSQRIDTAVYTLEKSAANRQKDKMQTLLEQHDASLDRIKELEDRVSSVDLNLRFVLNNQQESIGRDCPCLRRPPGHTATPRDTPPHMSPEKPHVVIDEPTDETDTAPAEPLVAPKTEPSLGDPLRATTAPPGTLVPIRPKIRDLPTFTALSDRDDVDTWITRITAIYTQMKIPYDEIVSNLPLLLKRNAADWLAGLTDDERARLATWEDWCAELRTAFRPANYLSKKTNELRLRTLRAGESFADYFAARTALQRIVMPDASESTRIDDLLMGLPIHMHPHVKSGLVAEHARTLTAFRRVLIDLEPSLNRNARAPTSTRTFEPRQRDRNAPYAPRYRANDTYTERDTGGNQETTRARYGASPGPPARVRVERTTYEATPRAGYTGRDRGTDRAPPGRYQRGGAPRYTGMNSGAPTATREARAQVADADREEDDPSDATPTPEEEGYTDRSSDAYDSDEGANFAESYAVTTRSRAKADLVGAPTASGPTGEPITPKPARPGRKHRRDPGIAPGVPPLPTPADNSPDLSDVGQHGGTFRDDDQSAPDAAVLPIPLITVTPPSDDDSSSIVSAETDMDYTNKSPAFMPLLVKEAATQVPLKACADTGSSISLIDDKLRRRYFSKVPLKRCQVINVKGVAGHTVITHYIMLTLQLDDTQGRKVELPSKLYVNPAEDGRIILGNDWMMYYGASGRSRYHCECSENTHPQCAQPKVLRFVHSIRRD